MAKSLKDILNGVKSSKTETPDLSDIHDYGNGAGKEFISKHKIEKHEDRVGNGDDVYKGKTKKASYKGSTNEEYVEESNKENKAKKRALKDVTKEKPMNKFDPREAFSAMKRGRVAESSCNKSPAGTHCEMHGEDDCSSDTKKKGKKLLLDKDKKVDEGRVEDLMHRNGTKELAAIAAASGKRPTKLKTGYANGYKELKKTGEMFGGARKFSAGTGKRNIEAGDMAVVGGKVNVGRKLKEDEDQSNAD